MLDPEELHVWHLGALQYFLGSVLVILAFEVLPLSPPKNVDTIWQGITAHYKKHATPTQYANFNLSSFAAEKNPLGEFPMLKGKGAESKRMLAAVADVWASLARIHTNYHAILEMMKAMLEVQSHT